MLKLVADAKLPFLVRMCRRRCLGAIELRIGRRHQSGGNGCRARPLAIDACKDGPGEDEGYRRLPFRRRMLCRLDAVLVALGGDEEEEKSLKGIALLAKEPPQKAFIAGLQKAVKDAIDSSTTKKTSRRSARRSRQKLEDMKAAVHEASAALEQLLQKKP